MSPKKHQPLPRTHLREPATIPVLFMHHISDGDVIETEYIDHTASPQAHPAGQHLQDRFRQAPRGSQYTPPPHNNVPAKPWLNNKFGGTHIPGPEYANPHTGQPEIGDMPHFIYLEVDRIRQSLKGAFFLSRRMIIVILFLFSLMIIGAQSVPDILELVFSFI